MIYFKDTVERDARRVISNLRSIDRLEARLLHGLSEDEEILSRVLANPSYTAYLDRTPVALFGAVQIEGPWGSPWFIGTDECVSQPVALLRALRPVYDQITAPFTHVTNTMLKANIVHIAMLKRMLGVDAWEEGELDDGTKIVRFIQCVYPQ